MLNKSRTLAGAGIEQQQQQQRGSAFTLFKSVHQSYRRRRRRTVGITFETKWMENGRRRRRRRGRRVITAGWNEKGRRPLCVCVSLYSLYFSFFFVSSSSPRPLLHLRALCAWAYSSSSSIRLEYDRRVDGSRVQRKERGERTSTTATQSAAFSNHFVFV